MIGGARVYELAHQPFDRTCRSGDRLAARLGAPSTIDAVIERTAKGTGPGHDERIERPKVQIDDQLASLWAYFTLTRAGETKIDFCGTNLFLLREGPDGWKVFQIAATSRTEGCRAIAK